MKSVRPIRGPADHKAALAEIERLWDAEAGTPEGDRLEVLAVLVDGYEREHHPILPPDPIEAIKFRLEQKGLSRGALGPIMNCTRGRVSEILARRRGLTLTMIRALRTELSIPADALIADTEKEVARRRPQGRQKKKTRGAPVKGPRDAQKPQNRTPDR